MRVNKGKMLIQAHFQIRGPVTPNHPADTSIVNSMPASDF